LGLIFQSFELLPHLSVADNILLPCRMTHLIRLTVELRHRAAELAERMGIASKFPDPVANLSQGERQRVAICRALLLDPDVLLCDEPTGNLDPANKQRVLDALLDDVRQSGTTMIMVTHDHQLLDRFDDTVRTGDWVQPSARMPAES
jgi:putative ABC transport system ATP-binding protein